MKIDVELTNEQAEILVKHYGGIDEGAQGCINMVCGIFQTLDKMDWAKPEVTMVQSEPPSTQPLEGLAGGEW